MAYLSDMLALHTAADGNKRFPRAQRHCKASPILASQFLVHNFVELADKLTVELTGLE